MGFSNKNGISLSSGFKYQAENPLDLRSSVDTIEERDELVTLHAAWEGMQVYVKADKKTYEYRGGNTWTPVLTGNMYTHPTYTAKNNGLYKVTVDGTGHVSETSAVTKSDITALGIPGSDTTYSTFKGATASAAGGTGLVPIPSAGSNDKFLRGDGSWQTPLQYEANLKWGGKNFIGAFGPIDAAMVPDLGANRFAFLDPNGITIEYSRDGGSTWTDYDTSDEAKRRLFSTGTTFRIGKADDTNKATENTDQYQLRITVDTDKVRLYTILNKFIILASTDGSNYSWCTIDASLEATPTVFKTFADKILIGGWSGWNVINTNDLITFGNTPSTQYGLIRFTFGANGGNTNHLGLQISRIMAFGGMGWSTPSSMAKYGSIYSYDAYQNVTFPNNVTASNFLGNASSATKATQDSAGQQINTTYLKDLSINGKTITYTKGDGTSGTLTTQDTNTTYSDVTTSAHGLMTSADKVKLDGIAENANNYVHPSYTSKSSGLYKITVDANGHVSGATEVIKNDITALGIPDSDTTYETATTEANGLMSSADKVKLNGIAEGANKYTHPSYTAKSSGLYKITVDSTGHVSAVRAVAKSDITALGIPSSNTTYNDATTSAHGLMTASDKTKLNGIADNANNYIHPTSSGNKHIPSGGASGNVLTWSADGTAEWGSVPSDATPITREEYDKLLLNGTYDPDKYYYVTGDFDTDTVIDDTSISTSTAYSSSKVNNLLTYKVNKSNKTSLTMYASSWSGSSAPYTISLSITGVTTSNNVEILLPGSATDAQVEAWMSAGIVNGTQSTNRVTLKAYGDLPSINIPIEVIIRND